MASVSVLFKYGFAFEIRKSTPLIAAALAGERQWFAAEYDHPSRGTVAVQTQYLPQAEADQGYMYERCVAHYMNSRVGQVVVDVGGGKSCPFAKYRDPAAKAKIIAVDVSEEELQYNSEVDEVRVADILEGLPFGAEEVDLLVS